MRNRFFKLSNALDISELCLGAESVVAGASTQTGEDVSGFFFPTDLYQPSRRLGKEPDSGEEDDQEDDLECDGETPTEGRSAVVDER